MSQYEFTKFQGGFKDGGDGAGEENTPPPAIQNPEVREEKQVKEDEQHEATGGEAGTKTKEESTENQQHQPDRR